MEKIDEIIRRLDEHDGRISKLENKEPKNKGKALVKPNKDSLPNKIISLRDEDFFKPPKIVEEINKELSSKGYHCESNRVSMALIRLAKKGELRKATKIVSDKSQKAYAW